MDHSQVWRNRSVAQAYLASHSICCKWPCSDSSFPYSKSIGLCVKHDPSGTGAKALEKGAKKRQSGSESTGACCVT
eukprot:3693769-Amphidinium_carterae.2